jgi:hypothetical protein
MYAWHHSSEVSCLVVAFRARTVPFLYFVEDEEWMPGDEFEVSARAGKFALQEILYSILAASGRFATALGLRVHHAVDFAYFNKDTAPTISLFSSIDSDSQISRPTPVV